jgi:hypothetical protein
MRRRCGVVDIAEKAREAEIVWTCNTKRRRRADQRHYGMKRLEYVEW